MTSNIVHVRETSVAAGAAASQVLASSTELQEQAATLKSQVEEFLQHVRTPDQAAGPLDADLHPEGSERRLAVAG